MPNRYYSSTSVTTSLTGTVTSGTTSITLGSVVGMPGSVPYTLILDPDTLAEEIVTVTSASGTTLTVLRGQDGSTAQAHTAGAVVLHGVSARDFREPQAHMDLLADVHGVTGALASAASVTALSSATTTSLGGKVDKSTLGGLGHIVTATAAATPYDLAPGANGTVLTADSTQTSGLKYASVTGTVLATTALNPSTVASVTAAGSVSTTTFASATATADLNASATVTFTAPSSGNVIVELTMPSIGGATASGHVWWTLRSGSADVAGTACVAVAQGAGAVPGPVTTRHYVSGLTPGNSYTYKWGWNYGFNGSGPTMQWGGTSTSSFGPLVMSVRTA